MVSDRSDAPLIAHVIVRFDYGGLENGVANIVNGISDDRYRHAIIALTEATSFQKRLRKGVSVFTLGKRPGKDFGAYIRLFSLLRQLKPDIVHTRNLGTLDCIFVAAIAGVKGRIHGEHGWDTMDPTGSNRKYRLLRRFLIRFVQKVVAVSDEISRWLTESLRVPSSKVCRICNGVDTRKFRPRETADRAGLPEGFAGENDIVVGSVTRFAEIKNPMNLVEAFIRLHDGPGETRYRLVMLGDGELRETALSRLADAGVENDAWLPGSSDDVSQLLRCMDIFVLGSTREGISNTVLEAMASGLPVIASATGGNFELIDDGQTGILVPPGDFESLADSIRFYARDSERRIRDGRLARQRAIEEFSIAGMIDNYCKLYTSVLNSIGA